MHKNKKKLTIISIIVIVLIALGLGGVAYANNQYSWSETTDSITKTIDDLGNLAKSRKTKIAENTAKINQLQTDLDSAKNSYSQLLSSNGELSNKVLDLQNQLTSKDSTIASKDSEIQAKIAEIQQKIAEGNQKVADKQKEVDGLNTQLAEQKNINQQLTSDNSEKDNELSALKAKVNEIDKHGKQVLQDAQ